MLLIADATNASRLQLWQWRWWCKADESCHGVKQLRRNSVSWANEWKSLSLTRTLPSFVFCLTSEWQSGTRAKWNMTASWIDLCCFLIRDVSPSYTWKNCSSPVVKLLLFLCVSKSSTVVVPSEKLWIPGCVALAVKHTVMPIPKWCLFLALISQQAQGPRNATPLINKVNERYMYRIQDPDL